MFVSLQDSLFDVAEDSATVAELPGDLRRTVLTGGAWVDHLPGWMGGSATLFDELVEGVPWRAERRTMYDRVVDVPRLTSFYDENTDLPHPALAAAREALNRYYEPELGERLVTAGLCFYRDQNDSVAWHGDTIGRGKTEDTMVAIVSLGTDRPLLLRPVGGGPSLRFHLGHGDLLVMGGSCQRTWEHCVPKVGRATGPRISVQFRPKGVR